MLLISNVIAITNSIVNYAITTIIVGFYMVRNIEDLQIISGTGTNY